MNYLNRTYSRWFEILDADWNLRPPHFGILTDFDGSFGYKVEVATPRIELIEKLKLQSVRPSSLLLVNSICIVCGNLSYYSSSTLFSKWERIGEPLSQPIANELLANGTIANWVRLNPLVYRVLQEDLNTSVLCFSDKAIISRGFVCGLCKLPTSKLLSEIIQQLQGGSRETPKIFCQFCASTNLSNYNSLLRVKDVRKLLRNKNPIKFEIE